jgi:hypothetical protein
MVIEMLLNIDIQFIFCSNDFKLSKRNKCTLCTLLNFFKKRSWIISFEQKILIIYEFSKYMFL